VYACIYVYMRVQHYTVHWLTVPTCAPYRQCILLRRLHWRLS